MSSHELRVTRSRSSSNPSLGQRSLDIGDINFDSIFPRAYSFQNLMTSSSHKDALNITPLGKRVRGAENISDKEMHLQTFEFKDRRVSG
jgi:hypothetical protein